MISQCYSNVWQRTQVFFGHSSLLLCDEGHRSGSDVGKKRRVITEETKKLDQRIQWGQELTRSENAALPVQDFLTKLVFLSERFTSAATMSKMTQDAKKDEFRKYLEKAGVLELLTKSLVSVRLVFSCSSRFNWQLIFELCQLNAQLYEEPEKPNDALSYLKNSVGGRYIWQINKEILWRRIHPSCSPTDKEMIAKLREENELLKGKVKELEASQVALEARVAALSAGSVSSSAEEKEDQAPTAAAQPSSEPAAPATVETPSDASGTTAESKPAEEKSDSEGIKLLEILPWVLNLMNWCFEESICLKANRVSQHFSLCSCWTNGDWSICWHACRRCCWDTQRSQSR